MVTRAVNDMVNRASFISELRVSPTETSNLTEPACGDMPRSMPLTPVQHLICQHGTSHNR